jgi:PAS domain S-box-containing protein
MPEWPTTDTSMVDVVYPSLVLLAGALGITIGALAWRARDQEGARALAVFVTAGGLWTIAEGLSVVRAGLETSRFWTQVALSLSVVPPLAWLLLVLAYTGRRHRVTRRLLAALLVEPLVFLALVWTSTEHTLVWETTDLAPIGAFDGFTGEFGIAFWGHQAYTYLLLTAGVVLLVRMLLRTNDLFRWQSTAWLFAIAVPITGNALYIFRQLPAGLDPTGVSYVLAGLLLALALFESQLRSVAPAAREIGREAVLSELDDAMVILDDDDRIVDANPAGEQLLGTDEFLGRELAVVRPALAEGIEDAGERTELELEHDGRLRYYDVRISSVYGGYGTVSGRVLSLRDVTEREEREQRLDVLNRLLRHNIRNELNLVRGQIELAEPHLEDGDGQQRLAKAKDALDGVVARSDKVGRLSRLLETETGEIDIARGTSGEVATGDLAQLDGDIELSLPENLRVNGGQSLVPALAELIENGIQHNDAAEPRVTVAVDEDRSDTAHVVLTVSDNGPGIDKQEFQTILDGEETDLQHGSGVGLWLVNWVVRRAGGSLSFENTQEGCTVSVRLPRAGQSEPAVRDTDGQSASVIEDADGQG